MAIINKHLLKTMWHTKHSDQQQLQNGKCNGLTKCELQNPLYDIKTSTKSWV